MADEQDRLMQADDTLSPVDLPGDDYGGDPLRWASVAIAVAALFLLACNAVTIDGWAKDLPPGPVAARLTQATAGWVAATDRLGLGKPRAIVHAQWQRAQALSFAAGPAAARPAPATSPPSR